MILVSLTFISLDALADAWGQHYSKCYVGTKRYRAHASIRNLQYYNPYNTGYGGNAWLQSVYNFDKGCTSAFTTASYYGGLYVLTGTPALTPTYVVRSGSAYSDHKKNFADNRTYTDNAYTSAGGFYYIPLNIDTTINRTGISDVNFFSEPYIDSGDTDLKIKNFEGYLKATKEKFYTSKIRVLFVYPKNFDVFINGELGNYDNIDSLLANHNLLAQGTLSLNGKNGLSGNGLFESDAASLYNALTLEEDEFGNENYALDLSKLTNITFTIPDSLKDKVSIITFADSYYDFQAEEASNKKDTEINVLLQSSFDIYATTNNKVVFTPTKDEDAVVSLYDISGKHIKDLYNAKTKAGVKYNFSINTSDLPKGLYLIRYQSISEGKTIRFVNSK